ncbi:MAG: sulfatase-like hydrolase/transferase [Flavobacteriaceae bacterium]|nr:sulfatase-like hydrolase/transferase [Flavobacteriaceae bacterium]
MRTIVRITKTGFYRVCLMGISVLFVACGNKAKERPQSGKGPNILFIYTDDQAAWDFGLHGNQQAHTPNMDQLAREGGYFPNAYVSTPVCSPARVALLTGQYASEYGIYDFIPPPGHKLYDPSKESGLDPKSITFPEMLQHNGYVTGLVGKFHVGDWLNDPQRKHHPVNNGYDYFMGLTGGGASPKDPTLELDGTVGKIEGYTSNILTDHAIGFIKEHSEGPFLLSLHYRAPHGRWLPVPDEDWAPYEDMDPDVPDPDYPDLNTKAVKKKMREYMASTSGMDRNMGRVLQALKELGIEDNTIVIFTSDHGYNMGHHGIEHKGNGIWITKTPHPAKGNLARNSRPNLYETSLKVPMLIKWPGVVEPGSRYDHVVSSLDWYPTLAEMAKAEIPEGKILRGKSMVPILKGKEIPKERDIYAEYSMINYSKAYMRSYRNANWKLVKDFLNEGRDELYNMKTDPEEEHNLINEGDEQLEKVKEMLTGKILGKMEEIGDPLLERLQKESIQE